MWRANKVQAALNGAGAPALCESAGTGRQARLRGVCQPTWEFKSPLSHHIKDGYFDKVAVLIVFAFK